jgi:hypothetical protein
MKKSFLTLFILLLISFFFLLSCQKEDDGGISLLPKEGWGCVTCEDETTTSTVKNLKGKVVRIVRAANNTEGKVFSYGIDISKYSYNRETWAATNDSLLVPCPDLPLEWQQVNLKVKVSGNVKSCNNLLPDYLLRLLYGRKFEITSIK